MEAKETIIKIKKLKANEYIEGIGRRKTASARVRISSSNKTNLTVNTKNGSDFFPSDILEATALESLTKSEIPDTFNISVHVRGGGVSAQAGAIRHGLARALIEFDPALRKTLKAEGFLKRDPRAKERRKFGLKKARKRAQWSKR